MHQDELTALFRRLGARSPEGWARSQAREGIPQLARFLFLRQAWRGIVDEDDHGWMDAEIASAKESPDATFAGIGRAVARLRGKGADDRDLVDLVRGMQAQLLFHICYLLDDPGDVEPEVEDISWGLVQTDDDDHVMGFIRGLHESVLETDPTGREMRPRPDAAQP